MTKGFSLCFWNFGILQSEVSICSYHESACVFFLCFEVILVVLLFTLWIFKLSHVYEINKNKE